MDKELQDLIKDYLESHGLDTSKVADLVDEYESMQDFTEMKDGSFIMVTGNSYDEVSDWIRHRSIEDLEIKSFASKVNEAFGTKIPEASKLAFDYIFDVYDTKEDFYRDLNCDLEEADEILENSPNIAYVDGKIVFFNEVNYDAAKHRPVVDNDIFTNKDLKDFRREQVKEGLMPVTKSQPEKMD